MESIYVPMSDICAISSTSGANTIPNDAPLDTEEQLIVTNDATDVIHDNNIQNNKNEQNHFIRMQVNPFAISKHERITKNRDTKQLPSLLQSLLTTPPPTTNTTTISSLKHTQQVTDEWISIWERLHEFIEKDTIIHQGHKETVQFYIFLCCVVVVYKFIVFGEIDYFTSYKINTELVVPISTLLVFLAISLYSFIYYRDKHFMVLNGQRRATRIYYLTFIITCCFTTYIVNIIERDIYLSDWCYHFVMYMTPVYILSLVTILTSIHVSISWVNLLYFLHEQRRKSLKKVYYEIKSINDDLSYFSLNPRLKLDDDIISVEVYKKVLSTVSSSCNSNKNILEVPSDITLEIRTSKRNRNNEKIPNTNFGIHEPLLL